MAFRKRASFEQREEPRAISPAYDHKFICSGYGVPLKNLLSMEVEGVALLRVERGTSTEDNRRAQHYLNVVCQKLKRRGYSEDYHVFVKPIRDYGGRWGTLVQRVR